MVAWFKRKSSNIHYRVPIGKGKIIRSGKDITIVAMSYMVVEAIHAVNFLENKSQMRIN